MDMGLTLILERFQIKDKQQIFQENRRIILLMENLIKILLYDDNDDDDDVFLWSLFLQSLLNE